MMITLPKCRHCGRPWKPPVNVVADNAYCDQCSPDRRALATEAFGLRRLTADGDDGGGYTIRRRDNAERLARILAIADDVAADPEGRSINVTGWSRERLLAHIRAAPRR